MKVRILGCSGSVGSRNNPASGYVVSADNVADVVMDLGPGTFAALAHDCNPSDVHVLFSHLHPDHCLDFPSLLVWRRYHPQAAANGRNLCFGPQATFTHLGALSADHPGEIDDMSDTYAFAPFQAQQPVYVERLSVTPYPVVHPTETFALRVEDPADGSVVCYSGDSAYTETLIEAARGADVFFCEATWCADGQGQPANMHMTGAEAGRIATAAGVRLLVLVHIPPWADPQEALASARTTFAGPIVLGEAGAVFDTSTINNHDQH